MREEIAIYFYIYYVNRVLYIYRLFASPLNIHPTICRFPTLLHYQMNWLTRAYSTNKYCCRNMGDLYDLINSYETWALIILNAMMNLFLFHIFFLFPLEQKLSPWLNMRLRKRQICFGNSISWTRHGSVFICWFEFTSIRIIAINVSVYRMERNPLRLYRKLIRCGISVIAFAQSARPNEKWCRIKGIFVPIHS